MAFPASDETDEKCRTGTFHWNSAETEELFFGSELGMSFKFNGFNCSLYTRRFQDSFVGTYTAFYMKNAFQDGFSSFYKFSVIDWKGNERFTATGSIDKEPFDRLISIPDSKKTLQGKELSLRLLLFENKRYIMSDKGIQVDPEESTLETLSKDFGRFYESKASTDCVLRIGEAQFLVHHQVLAARSTVFETMFRYDTLETRSGVVDIPDIQSDVMNDVLFYIYTGKIRNLTAASAISVYVAADKYALIELRDKCVDFLQHSLTLENFCDAAVLAHNHGESELENTVVSFIEERLEELKDDENWKFFLKNKPILASRMLYSALMANKVKMNMLSEKLKKN